jgi:hypothetical protein
MTNQIINNIEINISEKQLEDFLCFGKNLEKYLGLKFIARQVQIPPIGIIDILAFHKDSNSWVIIEIKKGNLDESAFCQLYSYLNFYRQTKSFIDTGHFQRKRRFVGLLIGRHLDDKLIKVVSLKDDYFNQDISYLLYNFDLAKGLEFAWYNKNQKNIEDALFELNYFNENKRIKMLMKPIKT